MSYILFLSRLCRPYDNSEHNYSWKRFWLFDRYWPWPWVKVTENL